MKNLFSVALLFWATALLASVQVQPGLTLTHGGQSYTIQYVNSEFSVRDTTLIDTLNHYNFSYVQMLPDYYDYVGEEGAPMYPAYTLFLQLPITATNLQVTIKSMHTVNVLLNNPYLPVQLTYEDSAAIVDMNQDLYSKSELLENYFHDWFSIEDKYIRYTSSGTNFTLYPVHYHTNSMAEVLTDAEFEITYEGSPLEEMYEDIDLLNVSFFDNYLDHDLFDPNIEPIINGDEYLIITESKFYDSIKVFADFKTSLGYNVEIVCTEDIGTTPTHIRNSIISHYFRPQGLKYVLLAGSIDEIPYSSGNNKEHYDEYTDMLYICLDETNIDEQVRMHPFVLLGRWVVNDNAELSNIIQKTIRAEQNMYNATARKRMHIFAGSGNIDYRTRAKWVKDNVISPCHNFICGNYTTHATTNLPEGVPYYDIQVQLQETELPLWMFVYFGNSDEEKLGLPYNFGYDNIESCVNKSLPFQPFAFVFADKIGMIDESKCFANSWIQSENGGVGILAASNTTLTECNKWFAYKLLAQLKNHDIKMPIGQLIMDSKEKYNSVLDYRRKHTAKYNYLGDPSLYVFGLNLENQANQMPSKKHNELVPEPCKVKVYTITGLLLAEMDNNEFDIKLLCGGTYIIVQLDKNNNILSTQKILK